MRMAIRRAQPMPDAIISSVGRCRPCLPSPGARPVIAFRFHQRRGVAQPGRAPGSGPGGRRFKSSLPDQFRVFRLFAPGLQIPPLQRTQGQARVPATRHASFPPLRSNHTHSCEERGDQVTTITIASLRKSRLKTLSSRPSSGESVPKILTASTAILGLLPLLSVIGVTDRRPPTIENLVGIVHGSQADLRSASRNKAASVQSPSVIEQHCCRIE